MPVQVRLVICCLCCCEMFGRSSQLYIAPSSTCTKKTSSQRDIFFDENEADTECAVSWTSATCVLPRFTISSLLHCGWAEAQLGKRRCLHTAASKPCNMPCHARAPSGHWRQTSANLLSIHPAMIAQDCLASEHLSPLAHNRGNGPSAISGPSHQCSGASMHDEWPVFGYLQHPNLHRQKETPSLSAARAG